jgi:hypothetical protein
MPIVGREVTSQNTNQSKIESDRENHFLMVVLAIYRRHVIRLQIRLQRPTCGPDRLRETL